MPKILIVEDSPTQAERFTIMLAEAGFDVERAERLDTGLDRLQRDGIDLLLLDLTLPDSDGLQTFLTARSASPDIPIVVLTGLDDESVAATALQQGAQDYLVKSEVNQNWLVRAVQHAIARGKSRHIEAPLRRHVETKPKQVVDVRSIGAVSLVRFRERRLLDASEIALLGEQLMQLVNSGCRQMVISFADVDYVSNGTLSALLAVRKKMLASNGTLRLCSLSENVLEHLSIRQFHKLFDILDDEESAIKSFN